MTFRLDKSSDKAERGFGCVRLSAEGVYAQDGYDRGHLVFDLHIAIPPNPGGSSVYFPIRGVVFDVREDWPFSWIGSEVWAAWISRLATARIPQPQGSCRSLPPYDEAGITYGPSGLRYAKLGQKYLLLSLTRVLLTSRCFSLGDSMRVFKFALHEDLPRDVCGLGRDFLKTGILCRKDDCTFFFPPDVGFHVYGPRLPRKLP